MKNIIFIAPPAAGKGTQSSLLQEKFNYVHLSTGDMLRETIASGSDFGLEVKSIIDKGNFVSDEVMIKMISDKLAKIKGTPFILDGFPRTLSQAEALDKLIDDKYIVIYLDLEKEEAIKRIEGRLTCGCGKSYNIYYDALKPKVDGICDICGKELIKRADDNADAFKIRFETYLNNTLPILDYYEKKNKLKRINVNKDMYGISEEIAKVIK